MFDIGSFELLLIAVIALVVLGPERLPVAAKFVGGIINKARNTWYGVQMELEREMQLDELRKQAEAFKDEISDNLTAASKDVSASLEPLKKNLEEMKGALNNNIKSTNDDLDALAERIAAKNKKTVVEADKTSDHTTLNKPDNTGN